MNKWEYITKISKKSNHEGDKLVELMDKYKANNLNEITLKQVKEFIIERNIENE